MVWSAMSCENPRHKEHVKNFVKGFPTAKGRVPDTIIKVDPNNWYFQIFQNLILFHAARQICSISEDIIRASNPERRKEPY